MYSKMDISFLLELSVITFMLGILDSSFGQGYGTIGTPLLLFLNLGPKVVVPSILFSQFIVASIATFMHHKLNNVNFKTFKTHDAKRFYVFSVSGLISVILASVIGATISSIYIRYYIGIMVTVIGILVLLNLKAKFTWWKASIIGIISAFNKGLTGGGFGPVVTGGQKIIGINGKSTVGVTLSSVAIICITGFITWTILNGLPPIYILIAMGISGAISSFIGPYITKISNEQILRFLLGGIILVLGIITLLGIAKA